MSVNDPIGDMITRMYLRRCLQVRGWEDTCQSNKVEFVWGGER